jgi:hypothetical protein
VIGFESHPLRHSLNLRFRSRRRGWLQRRGLRLRLGLAASNPTLSATHSTFGFVRGGAAGFSGAAFAFGSA